jgi:predicted TIM-barrel fold metal-dependent hydrolase
MRHDLNKEYTIISLEDHFLHPKVWEILPKEMKDKYDLLKDALFDIGEGRIKQMDAAGIDFQVISHVEPDVKLIKDTNEAIKLAKEINNYLSDAVKKFPDRLGGFAVLPMQSPDDAALELERTVTELGFKGAMIDGHTNGAYLDDASYAVLLKKAEKLDVPLYIHPTDPPKEIAEKYFENNDAVITGWAWQVETSIHLIRMINKGIFDKYPKLKIIVGHMGELIPYGFTRLNTSLTVGNWIIKSDNTQKMNLYYYFKNNIYITSSGVFDEPVFRCAKEMIGLDNMMFSVDFPFQDNVKATEFLEKLSLNHKEKNHFAGEKASHLLKLNQSGDCNYKTNKSSKFEVFKIRLKSKIGKYLINKLIKQ